MSELKEIGRVPSSEAERKQIAQPLLDILDDYVKIIMENVKDAVIRGAKDVIEELNKLEGTKESSKSIDIAQKVSLPFDAEEYSELISEQLKNKTFEASQRTLDRLSGNIMDNLAKSYELGLGIDDAADRLNDVFQSMEDYELVRVARTEINSAQNFGAMLTEEQLGVEYHQWWTAEDERVRTTHADMHGQIVKVGHPFSNGLIRPGDTNGDPSEFINCRCRVVPFLMPEGMTAPLGVDYFYEDDLVKMGTVEVPEERREHLEKMSNYDAIEQIEKDAIKAGVELTHDETVAIYEDVARWTREGSEKLRTFMHLGEEEYSRNLIEKYGKDYYNRIYKPIINELKRQADNIDKFIKISPKYPEKTIFRGLKVNKEVMETIIKPGNIISDAAFASYSSELERTINNFASNVILKVINKKGVSITHISAFPNEREILMPGNTKFRVVSAVQEMISGKEVMVVTMEEVL